MQSAGLAWRELRSSARHPGIGIRLLRQLHGVSPRQLPLAARAVTLPRSATVTYRW